ncbi:NAD(P)-binding protein [Coprinopsis marcescibilis]|uniref:NAD(P)-binding protein n=1 Tax=Coprinopsis marcescibilis TaxID=230819 RepID=A0A5C3L4K8_COPMA|nr:NAD(P)-binding protein [Coprinopsis marcescibilis]
MSSLLGWLLSQWLSLWFSFSNRVAFFKEAWFAGKPTWTLADVPDLTGQVIIVTGGSSGIGVETIRTLLRRNAKVYLAARNEKASNAVIVRLHSETGQKALFLKLDLTDLDSVKVAAREFQRKETRLDALYNNAGVSHVPVDQTINGYDIVFHTNVIGPFLLTKLLLPLLLETRKVRDDKRVRIIHLSSSAHHFAPPQLLDFATFKDGPARRKHGLDLNFFYCQSKVANILVSNEVARRYGSRGVISLAVNPGNFETPIQRNVPRWIQRVLKPVLFIHPYEWNSLAALWAGTSIEAGEINGKYIIPWGKVGTPRRETYDNSLGNELWTWLEEQPSVSESSWI